MDFKDLRFLSISLYEKQALAVTEDGKLYGWG